MDDLISRQAAINFVDDYIGTFDAIDVNFLDGLKTAKKLMMQLPSVQPTQLNTPNTLEALDCISRQAAIDRIEPWLDIKGYSEGELNIIRAVLCELKYIAPSAQPRSFSCGQENDAVSRAKINRFCHEIIRRDPLGDNDVVQAFEAFRAYVNCLPSVIPERKTEWIPCSERLPEESGRYLVTVDRRQLPENVIPICIVLFKNGEWLWDFDDSFIVFPLTITAWMPLPEPYREEGEQE